jgi:CBS domain-containing protein
MQLKDIMTKKVITVLEDETVTNAAREMREANIGCLVVANAGAVKGIFTDRDLTVKCLAEGHDPRLCRVSQHMTSSVIIAVPDMDILEATHLMSDKRIRRLPVLENGRLVGLVSSADIAQAMLHPIVHLMLGISPSRMVV